MDERSLIKWYITLGLCVGEGRLETKCVKRLCGLSRSVGVIVAAVTSVSVVKNDECMPYPPPTIP